MTAEVYSYTQTPEGETIFYSTSQCWKYMYDFLWKRDSEGQLCVFIALNPSRTKYIYNAPTVLSCKAIADDKGCGSMMLLNLFPYVATDWEALEKAKADGHDIKGDENEHKELLKKYLKTPNALIIMAWGDRGKGFKDSVDFQGQIDIVKDIIREGSNKNVMQLEKIGEEGLIHPYWLISHVEKQDDETYDKYNEEIKKIVLENYELQDFDYS